MEKYIVVYDGDGGGIGSHLRNLTYMEYFSWITGLQIINKHPVINLFFDHTYAKDLGEKLNPANSILIDDLFNRFSLYTYADIRQMVEGLSPEIHYILSGRGGGPGFIQNLPRLPYLHRLRLIERVSLRLGGAKYDLGDARLADSGITASEDYVAVHLRTFSDSLEGHSSYLKIKNLQFECFKLCVDNIISKASISQLLIASDNIGEAHELGHHLDCSRKICYDESDFVHSSTAHVFGRDILIGTDNLNYQIGMINKLENHSDTDFTYALATYALLQALGQSKFLVCSLTTFAPLSILFTSNRSCLTVIPNVDQNFSTPSYPYAPYCS